MTRAQNSYHLECASSDFWIWLFAKLSRSEIAPGDFCGAQGKGVSSGLPRRAFETGRGFEPTPISYAA